MKNIFEIFKKDIKEVFRKTRTWVLLLGLSLFPAIYAWPNILSSWDPYGHVNQLQVAVYSEDIGATADGKEVNLGSSLIEGLKNNKSLNWQFVDSKEKAEEGVKIGDYYASIVIPKNFSEDITSVTRGEPKKANIEYTVNEKINAISPKVTNSGASALANNISKSFVESANGIIFEKMHEAGIKFEENLPTIERVKTEIESLNDNFNTYDQQLKELIAKIDNGQNILHTVYNALPEVDRLATNSIMIADKAGIVINNIEGFNEQLLPRINEHLSNVETVAKDVNSIAKEVQNKPDRTEEIKTRLSGLDSRLEASTQRLEIVKNIFTYFNDLGGDNLFESQLNRVNTLISDINNVKNINKHIYDNIDNYDSIADNIKEQFVVKSQEIADKTSDFESRLNTEISPLVEKVLSKSKDATDRVSNVIYAAQGELPMVANKLSEVNTKINTAQSKLLTLNAEMPTIKSKLQALTDKIKETEGKVDNNALLNLLKVDYKQQADFFANPVSLQENKLYHIENYGSAMTPFYTVLSIWVGSLLISSLVTTKVEDDEKKYKPYQKYFGRWILFLIIALIQSIVVTVGDMYVLGTQAVSPYRFVLYGLLISLLFSAIIYTIVSIFGNIGKALCIILLVLQLGSSGGTFPIQMTSSFFQVLYPKVPFTYSIGLLREAVGGFYLPAVYRDVKTLVIYLVVMLAVGTISVTLIARSEKLSAEKEKSKLFL